MVKTTVYLPDEMKAALGREAARAHTSEAELIRAAVGRLLGMTSRPRPRFGQYRGEAMTVAELDAALAEGFGER
jgi:Arc/MetJ-type ribon-helix-helix transcriptional regulator